MIIKFFLFSLTFIALLNCQKEKKETIRPKSDFRVSQPDLSDRESNDGLLRFNLAGKAMHDNFFVAQFTPRGDIFQKDNLQLYNYNAGSDKYPQFIINLDYKDSILKNWETRTFPLDFLAFTPAPNQIPFNSKGQVTITKVTDSAVEGKFSGELVNPKNGKSFPVKGEFRAIIKVNT